MLDWLQYFHSLDFGFDKHLYNVYQVNKTSYEQCNDHDFIKNITRGGRDVFNLTEAKPFYFLSGGGYCYHGMKLAINVVEFIPSPESAPAPAKNGSPADTGGQIILSILLAIALVWASTWTYVLLKNTIPLEKSYSTTLKFQG